MSESSWSPDFSVGIDEIDTQHKQLFHTFDVLKEALTKNSGGNQLSVLFIEMLGYVERHLRYEERMLEKHGYPESAAHKAAHHALEERVMAFYDRYYEHPGEQEETALAVSDFLKDWLTGHIFESDRHYAEFLKGTRVYGQVARGPAEALITS